MKLGKRERVLELFNWCSLGIIHTVKSVRLFHVISHSFATSHHPTQTKCLISFIPPLAPSEFPTQMNHGLLLLTTAGAERTMKTLTAVLSERAS